MEYYPKGDLQGLLDSLTAAQTRVFNNAGDQKAFNDATLASRLITIINEMNRKIVSLQ